ncbi:hypothetical protein Aph01nite_08680 [Acrocarpospora phusangensis]|uniref:Uncharacterized protein n=1 Tax=Acrocarpospora phusangensis TaxID=1070424 RepID=A0A919Q7Y1_9ACTN|nr:hypothetical protein Aph01nite_08680 [Acrocarpospora phusangensis]
MGNVLAGVVSAATAGPARSTDKKPARTTANFIGKHPICQEMDDKCPLGEI